MALPVYPADDAAFLAALNSNPYDPDTNQFGLDEGGHITLFPEAMSAIERIGDYFSALGAALQALANQTAADADSAAAGSGTEASAADIRAGLTAHYLSIRRAYAAGVFVPLIDAASIAWDMASGINFSVTLGAAGRAVANPSGAVEGKSGILAVKQDGTGGRSITAWGANFVWVGDQPIWPTTPNAETLISYIVRANGKIYLNFGGSTP